MSVHSELRVLSDIVTDGMRFCVPIYQRLYVWDADQVRTLLEDLWTAFETDKGIYYLGGTLVVKSRDERGEEIYDLIDGQQRFTTLWMMAVAWHGAMEPFVFRRQGRTFEQRMDFPIRPEVRDYFSRQAADTGGELGSHPLIVDALERLRSFKNERSAVANDKWDRFVEFVYTKVTLLLTTVPRHTDLNKLFEVINNRGIQLQHHDILKAKLLARIGDAKTRNRYAKLWDACAEMDGFVERNLRRMTHVKVTDLYTKDEEGDGVELLANAEHVLALLEDQEVDAFALTLDTILSEPAYNREGPPEDEEDEEYEARDVRSIIGFPLLLQHTLRIWLQRRGHADLPKILEKELLTLFAEHFLPRCTSEADVASFVELLWEIRYLFDKHIIKWVTLDEEEQHLICALYRSSSTSRGKIYYSLQRRHRPNDGFSLLQSMLYHSQQITTHYWLTPLLSYLHQFPDATPLPYLQHLDNHLLSVADDGTLAERTHAFLDQPWLEGKLDCTVLAESLGVAFPHYWFYKLEFILWLTNYPGLTEDQRGAFRITAKNSVEHVSPQNPLKVDTNTVSDAVRDQFGNLALVSRSINSEYSNLPFVEKRTRFLNRNTTRIDSLKSMLIYRNEMWNDALALEHQRQMISVVKDYLQLTQRI